MSELIPRLSHLTLPPNRFTYGQTVKVSKTGETFEIDDFYYDTRFGWHYVSDIKNVSAFEYELETVSNVS